MLLFQILVSFAIAAVAVAIMRISAVQVPFDSVAPRYLKLVTSCKGSPFMVMLTPMLLVLFTMTLDFSVLTSIRMPWLLSQA